MIKQGSELDVLGQCLRYLREHAADILDDVDGGSAAIFQDAEEGSSHAILPDDVRLRGIAVTHMGDVVYVYGDAVNRLDGDIVQLANRLRAGVELDLMLEGAEFCGAGRQNKILRADGIDDIHRREVFGL